MTTKLLSAQSLSIRPQSDAENIILSNISAMIISGKEAHIRFQDTDMIIEIKSKEKEA